MHAGTVDIPHPAGRKAVVLIPRQHRFTNRANLANFYYQQRFNSADAEDARTVGEELQMSGVTEEEAKVSLERFGIAHLLHSPLIWLSNGEHKRFQLTRALSQKPAWLLLDNPFAGLDAKAREHLDNILAGLVSEGMGVLICCGPGSVPRSATQVARLERGRLRIIERSELTWPAEGLWNDGEDADTNPPVSLPSVYEYPDFEIAVRMRNLTVGYGGRRILDELDWEVRKGECWNISGPNGSGKSTLLSLINADNPQAYAQDIVLFDRPKGSGESIWDIKRMIGYVSPELHQHFESSIDAFSVVASGLFDTIGLFRRVEGVYRESASAIMDRMRIGHLSGRRFHTLSDGEQRQVLLARALVKDPPMLILDEPCQGLDTAAVRHFNRMVDRVCGSGRKTLLYVSHYRSEIPECVGHRLELPASEAARV
ncbi:MAG: ATP-binding cassette domain-containing protein [Chitinophagia bacterium]|nr:ATP-binding cassette domain-containing protein [Chitinophagia bacterium]